MAYLSVDKYSEKQKRAAARVLDMLDQLDARLASHYAGKRQHDRMKIRSTATLCLPDAGQTIINPESGQTCKVHIRSVSQSGLSFIYPGPIPQPRVLFGLDVANGDITWLVAEIVRQREMEEEGFWEFGVRFVQRAAM